MSDRSALIHDFLAGTPFYDWKTSALAGDASARSYTRLTKAGRSVIFMDSDPSQGQSTQRFADVAVFLRTHNLAAPDVYAHDATHGFMVLEDLGPDDFSKWIARYPSAAPTLYAHATDVLITLNELVPPRDLSVMTPEIAGDMIDVTAEWYAGVELKELQAEITEHVATFCGPPKHVALRDFHAENLIWRADQKHLAKVGLLDFQDAFIAPCGYDLASLLRDVRRRVDPIIAKDAVERFASANVVPVDDLTASLAVLGAQRNLRILGVFARLAIRDNKPGYLRLIPFVSELIQEDLKHPRLSKLHQAAAGCLPSPDQSAIKDLL